ncbi:MAG: hypothetical protein NXI22_02485 [bacterium]|nr:hypothetical protein [bacterium]
MPLAAQNVRCIEPPDWADVSPPRADDAFDPGVLVTIRDAHHKLLTATHAAVVEYLADPQLCFDDDNFPSTRTLTGDYYISATSHIWHADHSAFHVAVMTNFLGTSPGPQSPDDYLGLEVHLQWLPDSQSFVSWRNTDSSVI